MTTLFKNRAIVAAMGLLSMLAVPAAFAESHAAQVQVPFAFRAGEQMLPAGEYRAEFDGVKNVVTLTSADGNVSMYLSSHSAYRVEAKSLPTLVFERAGNTHFLRQVWMGNARSGRELPLSKAERETQRAGVTTVEVAGS